MPSNSEEVTTPSPSNIGAKSGKAGMGLDNNNKTFKKLIQMLIFWQLTLLTLNYLPNYSESDSHLSSLRETKDVWCLSQFGNLISFFSLLSRSKHMMGSKERCLLGLCEERTFMCSDLGLKH